MKNFLLICDKNCATYKEVFPLFKQGIVSFSSPVKEYDGTDRKFGNHSWITTFPVPNKKKLILTAIYDPDKYPKYDNYDAIEVGRIKDIPIDYDGVMGVPITILDYDLDNVEIMNMSTMSGMDANYWTFVDGKPHYSRVFIKKNFEIVGEKTINGKATKINGKEKYRRVLIRRKNN